MATSANFQIRMDPSMLNEAREIAKEMGTDLPSVVRMFLSQFIRDRRLPFTPNLDDSLYSPENVRSILNGLKEIKEGHGIEVTLEELRDMEKAS
ncbi:MAG TPA: type II toxin-antitoxin system RelB/DinJ family antitoxin [Candidatus Avisuccinivibrio pullicola]|nr:type II toxin-antitoxin system RelB/DinJ family antitoxin [Candidatus Avisuccinivibrio pullicola]